jgi:GTP cyclohydrolase I
MLPFTGTATVAYRPSPGQQIVGLSKLSRVVQGYAARFQVQERICAQVVGAITDKLNPSGAMCLITATHDCMRLRGVRDPSSATTTQARDGLLLPEEISLIHQQHRLA